MVLVYLLILLCDCQRTKKINLKMVGLARLELATPSLSGTYSNHLSYNPTFKLELSFLELSVPNIYLFYDEMMMKYQT